MRADVKKNAASLLWILASLCIGFGLGYIHHRWFYSTYFHGDSTNMYILAQAMLDEKSFLPKDFNYGNQIVFLRSNLFIALAMYLKQVGYKAFLLGSSLSIAFWFFVLHRFLSVYFTNKWKALWLSIALFVPIGIWEADFMFGQESHLSNVILSLCLLVSAHRYLNENKKVWLAWLAIGLFAMSTEAPMRGALVAAPLILTTILFSRPLRAMTLTSTTSASLILAHMANKKLLVTHPISLNYVETLTLKSSGEVISNLIKNTTDAVGDISNLNMAANKHLEASHLFIYASSLGFLFIVATFFIVNTGAVFLLLAKKVFGLYGQKMVETVETDRGVQDHVKQNRPGPAGAWPHLNPKTQEENEQVHFMTCAAIFGLFVGAIAVAAAQPDSPRHYLWAFETLKFCLLSALYDRLSSSFSSVVHQKLAGVSLALLCLIPSWWLAIYITHEGKLKNVIRDRTSSAIVRKIKQISSERRIKQIYGEDFWRMMPLNTYIPEIHADALIEPSNLRPYMWLSRPSWSCVTGPVLYYLRDGETDRAIEAKLTQVRGEKVYDADGDALWVGPPIFKKGLSRSGTKIPDGRPGSCHESPDKPEP